jgi:hypothetical protein
LLQFSFYEEISQALKPHIPMILNDISGGIMDELLKDESIKKEIDKLTKYDIDDVLENNVDDGEKPFAISFSRGLFKGTDLDVENTDFDACDFEIVVVPFFTTKTSLLIGIHDFRKGKFSVKIHDFNEGKLLDLMELMGDMVYEVFPDSTNEDKVALLSALANESILRLTIYDEPTAEPIDDKGEIFLSNSPYFQLDNPILHQYIIKQKHS